MAEQIGVKSSATLSIHSHVNNAQGGLLNPDLALFPQPIVDFGDGSDGDVTIPNGITILTRDMSYNNLTLLNGAQLCVAGFTIKVKDKLTCNLGSTIWDTEGTLVGGQDGAAGVGGAGGVQAITGQRPYTYLSRAGGAGADGTAPAFSDVSNGGAGGGVGLGTGALIEGRIFAGSGGGGGGAVGTAPAAGSAGGAVLFGAAGGNGGNAQRIAGNHQKGGGGGGAGGSKIEIWSNEIDNNGVINGVGFAGGAGEGDVNAQAGGGGGGGGGVILIYYKTTSGGGLGVRNVNGGAGGTSFGGVANGAAGSAGFSYAMKIGS